MKKIGVFGGSFDPLHIGHIKLAKEALKLLNLDHLFFVPSYESIFEKHKIIASGSDRIKQIEVKLPKKCSVLAFEIKNQKRTYTWEIIRKIKTNENQIFLLMGADNFLKFKFWKHKNKILKSAKIVVFNRNVRLSKNLLFKYNAMVLKTKNYNFSSKKYKEGDMSQVTKEVQKYIAKNFLYLDKITRFFLTKKRYTHCKNVALLAKKYALKNSLDAKQAYYAGLTHDLTKEWTREQQISFMANKHKDFQRLPKKILHQYSASAWLKNEYLLPYPKIISAVGKHTTASVEMSFFDKIIYVADKIAPGRKFKQVKEIRKIADYNIDKAFLILLSISKREVMKKNANVSTEIKKIWKKWLIN